MSFQFELNGMLPSNIQLPKEDFFSLLKGNPDSFVFIKDSSSRYLYANPLFLDVMGVKSFKEIYKKTDMHLCRDAQKVKIYQQHDAETLETEKILQVHEEIVPKNNELIKKQMKGTIYPIYSSASKPIAVMGIVQPYNIPFKLTLETAISLNLDEMNTYFRRSHQVLVGGHAMSISKRELQCIIELIKGKTAGEMATALRLKQTTIESYINNLKNKLGASSKSSLVSTIFSQKIIQQVFL